MGPADDPWTFVHLDAYAGLLSQLADCIDLTGNLNPRKKSESKIRNELLVELLAKLHRLIVRKYKGKLTLWRDPESNASKGSLCDVLEMLVPYLPDAVPVAINHRSLQRFYVAAKKAK